MVAILRSLGREPIRVGDVPGFVINRLQFALLREAVELVDQGVVDPVDLDRLVADGLGRRWAAAGPLATVALGGADLFHRIAVELYPELSRRAEPPRSLSRIALSEDELESLRARRDRTLRAGAWGSIPTRPEAAREARLRRDRQSRLSALLAPHRAWPRGRSLRPRRCCARANRRAGSGRSDELGERQRPGPRSS